MIPKKGGINQFWKEDEGESEGEKRSLEDESMLEKK